MRPAARRLLAAAGLTLVALASPLPAEDVPARGRDDATGAMATATAAADREVLRRVMTAERVETGTPRPGPMLYLRDVSLAFNRALQRGLGRLAPGLSDLAGPLAIFAFQLLGLGLALVFALLLARFLRRRLAERPARAAAAAAPLEPLPASEGTGRSAEAWRDVLRRRLGEGRVDEAVEALWWWLATVLVPRGAEPSWTSRELLGRAGRGDLLPLVRRLDRMLYGAARPSVDEVRGLWRALREGAT